MDRITLNIEGPFWIIRRGRVFYRAERGDRERLERIVGSLATLAEEETVEATDKIFELAPEHNPRGTTDG